MSVISTEENLKIDQGADWDQEIRLPLDVLEDCTIVMTISGCNDDEDIILSSDPENGKIIIDNNTGWITISLSEEETAEMIRDGHYKIEIIDKNGKKNRWFTGIMVIKLDPTLL